RERRPTGAAPAAPALRRRAESRSQSPPVSLASIPLHAAPAQPQVQRAQVPVGNLTIKVDYGPIIYVPISGWADRAVASITSYTGAPPSAAQEAAVRALSTDQQKWLLFALQLLIDNAAAAPALGATDAVQRLVAQAPAGLYPPLPDMANLFVHEALEASGWMESALGSELTAPPATDAATVDAVVNPPSGTPGGKLKKAALKKRMTKAMRHFLKELDPAKWTSVGTQSLTTLQSLGDIVMAEARAFFAPYADAARGNLYSLQPAWKPSANIFSTVPMTPSAGDRRGYMRNRFELVGRNTQTAPRFIDTNIFSETGFDSSRPADKVVMNEIITGLLAEPGVPDIVDRLFKHTGQQDGSGTATRIGLVTEYDAGKASACKARWRGIDTLCHEVLHALEHPDFVTAASRVKFPQVLREGFTEVLGVELFNEHVRVKAAADPAFAAQMEAGVTGAPCPTIDAATIDYGAAGAGAKTIRDTVGPENFRAAFFLGRVDLAGLK
ncbi:MAG TPA: hypothetical protein VIT38_13750, partial [Allosphingosinicella sp.]